MPLLVAALSLPRIIGDGEWAHAIVDHERYEEDKARDLEAVHRFLREDALLGRWRSTNGLNARAEQPRE